MLRTHRDARVLIVEDYSDSAGLLQRLLGRNGMENVQVATDPRTVIDHLPEFEPDLVLLDLYMPYVDGYTVLRHIRAWSVRTYLPVVIMTADTRPETLLRAVADGATDFLAKPFNATEILIRVRNLLQTRALYLALNELDPSHSRRAGVPAEGGAAATPSTGTSVSLEA
jgi:PleD family two-component response regulator